MNATPATRTSTPAEIVGHYINGQAVADDNRPLPVTNPVNRCEVTRHVAMATQSTVEDAITLRPRRHFGAWRNTPPVKRAQASSSASSNCSKSMPTRSWN